MRRRPYTAFSGRAWDDPAPRRGRVEEPDPAVSYVNGRFFRRESSIRDPDNTITPDDQKVLGQRAREAAEARQARKGAHLAAAVRLGAALKVLKGEE